MSGCKCSWLPLVCQTSPQEGNLTIRKRSSECSLVFYRGSGSKSRLKWGFHYCLTSETVTDTVTSCGEWGQVGKWMSISGHEGSTTAPLISLWWAQERSVFPNLPWVCPFCVLCSLLFDVMSPLKKKKNVNLKQQKSMFYPFSFQSRWWVKCCCHKTFQFLMDTSSWRTKVFPWFFWPSLLSFLHLRNQGVGSGLSLISKHFAALFCTLSQGFWHPLACKHQDSNPCARVVICHWPEISLARNW